MKNPKKNKIGSVKSHFLDSGAFTLWTTAEKYHIENKCGRWDYYETDEFWEYVDKYAAFIKKYKIAIDLYANIDAIGNPEITYRNQKYLEDEYNLSPVPVVHYGTNISWLEKYIEEDYKLIGLGGLVGVKSKEGLRNWLDSCFQVICDTPNSLPIVKPHGFGVSAYKLLIRYPWWSVDSTNWLKIASFGSVLIPHKRRGVFVFTDEPYKIGISSESSNIRDAGKHYTTLSKMEKNIVKEWLKEIGIQLEDLVKDYKIRNKANLLFFEKMRAALPSYPHSFRFNRRCFLC